MLSSMKNLIVRSCSICVLLFSSSAFSTVLTFDDLPSNAGFINLSGTDYGDFTWSSNFYAINTPRFRPSGYRVGTVSGDYAIFNGYSSEVSISADLFNFVGAFFTAAWNNGLNLQVQGLSNGTIIYDETIIVNTTNPYWFDANFLAIDALTFRSFGGESAGFNGGGTHFVMDNFTYTPVPTPATILLMALGGIFMLRRNK